MKLNWSIVSIISRFTAVGIGILQSLFIVKILPVAEYGLIGLVGSIAALVGVYQNLGISSGSTREIAATETRENAFKVFLGSLTVRYLISLPLVIGLFVLAPYLGNEHYGKPEIILPLRIFAVVLFVQALQSVLNSVIQGLKKFAFLFTFQAAIAVVSLLIYIPIIYFYQYIGYFVALLVFNLVSTLVLGVYCITLFRGHISFPSKGELFSIIKAVFSIGIYVYVIKIILTFWEKLGPAYLANSVSAEMLGLFTFALFVASKVVVISDAVTDVTLPSMTDVYERNRDKFKEIFINGNSKAYFLIMVACVSLILLKQVIFIVIDYVFGFMGREPISIKYSYSFVIMDPLIIGFWAYSHINLLKSGISVPTKKMWEALVTYILLLGLTVLTFNILQIKLPEDPVMIFSYAMGLGAVIAYLFYIFAIKRSSDFWVLSQKDLIFTIISLVILGLYLLKISVIFVFVLYIIITAIFYVKSYKNKANT